MVRNMLKRLRAAARNKLRAFLGYDTELQALHRAQGALEGRQAQLDQLVRERTDIAADVDMRGGRECRNTVLVIGRYRHTDYVRMFSLDEPELGHLVDQLRGMERHGVVRYIDAPPQLSAVIKKRVRW